MIRGFYTARSGMIAHQQRIDTVANNLANANTVAFKPMRTNFKDLVYQNVNRPAAQDTAMTGHGVKVNKNGLDMAQGRLESTDRNFDLALTHDGDFFMVETPEGGNLYTRAGNFHLSNEDNEFYLVDGSGNYVLDSEEERIEIVVEDGGTAQFDPSMVGVWRFPNPHGLIASGNNHFAPSVSAGEPELLEIPEYKQGYLEGSATDVAYEMTAVIEASKAFSFSSRMLMVADEIEQTVNSLR